MDTWQHTEEETADEASRAAPDSWSESDHDDPILDNDYIPKKENWSTSGSDTDSSQHSEEEKGEEVEHREEGGGERSEERGHACKRHKNPRSHMWKRQMMKEKRLKGESYQDAKGKERQPKTMGPPCRSQYCLRSTKRSCELLCGEERTDILKKFWSMPSWETRKLYIQALIENVSDLLE